MVAQNHTSAYQSLEDRIKFYKYTETNQWKKIVEQMHFPADEGRGVFLQQDGFLDKELMPATDLSPEDRPINQNWSWDRILRSCFIKQADVLQGLYFFEDHFDRATIERNFDFYEPMTVHESSLSPCVHAILAASLGKQEKAYEMYLRTARLDLDDYNNDTEDGLHITSMAGTWMAFVKGFGGMRVTNDKIAFNPFIPKNWQGYSFKILFRGYQLELKVKQDQLTVTNFSNESIALLVYGQEYQVGPQNNLQLPVGSVLSV